MPKPNWPAWVWVNLSAKDFKGLSFYDMIRREFCGGGNMTKVWCAIWEASKKLGCNCWVATDFQKARIWNKAMNLLGYTEKYDV